ncbi:MAG: hypothetical protein U0Q15_19955 [Kineosporiaceae bacterium]
MSDDVTIDETDDVVPAAAEVVPADVTPDEVVADVVGGGLGELAERQRDEVLAAVAAVEHSPQPVHEAALLALRDATLRRHVSAALKRVGRTLVPVPPNRWTSGYRDDVVAELTSAPDPWQPMPAIDRAVLVLVLIHSVAIPRSLGALDGDAWTSAHPTPLEEIARYAQLPRGQVRAALARLRAAGLVQPAMERSVPAGKPGGWAGSAASAQGTSYLPGPQLHRLTPAARRRLQEELILAAGPDTPLAAAIRARRGTSSVGTAASGD